MVFFASNQKTMLSIAQQITIFRFCLEDNILSNQQVIDWADQAILNTEDPEDFLVELSLTQVQDVNRIISILNAKQDLKPTSLIWQTLYGLAGYLQQNRVVTLLHACRFIARVANEVNSTTEYELFGMAIDDHFYIGNVDIVANTFLEITQEFMPLGKTFYNNLQSS